LRELLTSSPAELEHSDIALVNLLCAQGLPGAEGVSIPELLITLDQWTHRVRSETDRHLYRFRSNPAEYDHSEGYFRMLLMAVVLYEDFGIRYNPNRITTGLPTAENDRFFADSRDLFLHGLLGERRTGTCSSMPVLYLVIGRRLGYPLKLVTTKAHLFLRWEDARERFNLEATGNGMNRYDDEHFRQWPFPLTEEEIRAEGYLKSLSAAEELAVFLSLRGNCLKEAARLEEATDCYAQASRLAPGWRSFRVLLAQSQEQPGQQVFGQQIERTPALPVIHSLNPSASHEPNPLHRVQRSLSPQF
jgi:hypothetical protein